MENTEPKTNSENQVSSDTLDGTKSVETDVSSSGKTAMTNSDTEVKSDASGNQNIGIENKETKKTPEPEVESNTIGNSRSPGKDRDL